MAVDKLSQDEVKLHIVAMASLRTKSGSLLGQNVTLQIGEAPPMIGTIFEYKWDPFVSGCVELLIDGPAGPFALTVRIDDRLT